MARLPDGIAGLLEMGRTGGRWLFRGVVRPLQPMIDRIKPDDPASALKAFKFNVVIGLAVVVAFFVNPTVVTIWPYLKPLFPQ